MKLTRRKKRLHQKKLAVMSSIARIRRVMRLDPEIVVIGDANAASSAAGKMMVEDIKRMAQGQNPYTEVVMAAPGSGMSVIHIEEPPCHVVCSRA